MQYLGDELYVDFDGDRIELFSHDGVKKTNQVFLDVETLPAFERYVAKLREERRMR